MIEFYVKVPEEKEAFFAQLIENLGYDYEKLFLSDDDDSVIEADENYYTDSDD